MTVYVDALRDWGVRYGRAGPQWCHLIGDTEAELHVFAARIGLQRRWYQAPPKQTHPHYDLTAGKRAQAIRAGAIELEPLPWGEKLREIRSAMKAGTWQSSVERMASEHDG